MIDQEEHVVSRMGRRVFGALVGLVLGLIVGFCLASFAVGFDGPFLLTVVLGTIGGALTGYFFPRPFLFLGELLIGIFTDVT